MSNSQLFSVDARAGVAKKVGIGHRPKPKTEKKELWVDKVVAVNPHVPVVMKPPVASAKPTALSQGTVLLQKKLGKVREAASRTLSHRAARAAQLAVAKPAPPVDSLDIWGAASSSSLVTSKRDVNASRKRMPEPSMAAPAVEVPSEGASWNPDFAAHQQLLAEATAHELKRQRKDKVHRRPDLFAPAPWEEDEEGEEEAADATEMQDAAGAAADSEDEDEDASDDDDDDEEGGGAGANGAKRPEERAQITRTQRNKQAQAKVRAKAEAEAAAQRKREKQLGRLGALSAEIKREEKALVVRQETEAEHEASRVRKLGPKKHEPARPDVLLSDEQPSALRQMVTEGSLMEDRFGAMQARNLIEARDFNLKPTRRKFKKVNNETSKDAKYKSPHGWAGKMPAWL